MRYPIEVEPCGLPKFEKTYHHWCGQCGRYLGYLHTTTGDTIGPHLKMCTGKKKPPEPPDTGV